MNIKNDEYIYINKYFFIVFCSCQTNSTKTFEEDKYIFNKISFPLIIDTFKTKVFERNESIEELNKAIKSERNMKKQFETLL